MEYDWYLIFNKTEFEALDLVSKEYTLNLEDIGEKTILVVQGNELSMVYDDIQLTVNMIGKNPFEFENHAIYIDSNNDVFLGVPIES